MTMSKEVIKQEAQHLALVDYFRHFAVPSSSSLVFQSNNSRLDFVLFGLSKGKNLPSLTGDVLKEYLKEQTKEHPTLPHEEKLSAHEMNQKKLAFLFAHLAVFHYKLGDLTIEPVALNDLFAKIRQINEMKNPQALHEYLDKLIGETIPEYEKKCL